MSEELLVSCNNLVKIYKVADLEVVALQGLDLEVQRGEIMALVGASGSGKSTLLNILGGLDTPSAGSVNVGNYDLLLMNDRERVTYKRDIVGFVWQQPGRNLLPYLSARENVELPMTLTGLPANQRRTRALQLLEILGLADRADFRPDRLSGGQQQRVALAVALANNPPLLLADEPTGQLDSRAAADVFAALRDVNAQFDTSIIVVTHDPKVAARVDRIVGIRDGRTSTEVRRSRDGVDGTVSEDEWVILDRTGRLQLPQVYVETLAMTGRVKARLEDDHVSIWPSQEELDAPVENIRQWRPETSFAFSNEEGRSSNGAPAVATRSLWRTFDVGVEKVDAIRDLHLTIPQGQLAVVKGRSGSGKTTLLNLLGGLDEPSQGEVIIGGQPLAALDSDGLIEMRRRQVGFVFQTFGLLPFMTARENVEAPLRLIRAARQERFRRATEALALVGLANRTEHRTH
ncbi:MAG: ATP-binding cassette domain-containing protein, partial [Anaerolineales bacterium]|nr:ATP-binding cassette domain-containing protein [Anaerolineales bacterium]